MTYPNDDDEQASVDPLAPKDAPLTKPMFGEKAYQYTLDRIASLEIYAKMDGKNYYKRQMAYYQFIKQLIEKIDQEELEKQAGQANWRKRK